MKRLWSLREKKEGNNTNHIQLDLIDSLCVSFFSSRKIYLFNTWKCIICCFANNHLFHDKPNKNPLNSIIFLFLNWWEYAAWYLLWLINSIIMNTYLHWISGFSLRKEARFPPLANCRIKCMKSTIFCCIPMPMKNIRLI